MRKDVNHFQPIIYLLEVFQYPSPLVFNQDLRNWAVPNILHHSLQIVLRQVRCP
jgi:hypothetical protein